MGQNTNHLQKDKHIDSKTSDASDKGSENVESVIPKQTEYS